MTLEALNKRIKTTTDLRDIVGTMKMLSSVSIGPYERALKSLDEYRQTVRDAFTGLMQDADFAYTPRRSKTDTPRTLAIIIGTDNGLVGRFNRDVLSFAAQNLEQAHLSDTAQVIGVGKRLGLMLPNTGLKTAVVYPIMNSLKEISTIASTILMTVNRLIATDKIEQVFVYYTRKFAGQPQKPTRKQLMPLPYAELMAMKQERWTGKTPPLVTADRMALFQNLIDAYLTVVLGEALTASLAAEHYTRMVNMQQAEKNIDASLEEMNLTYQQLRQTGITDELIDIVSGAESLKKKRNCV